MGRASLLCPGTSDVYLFRYRKGIIHLNAEVPHSAFDSSVTEQELDGSKIACAPVDQGRFGSSQRVCTEAVRVQPDARDPFGDKSSVLSRRNAAIKVATAGE